jgi:hypothetical protein
MFCIRARLQSGRKGPTNIWALDLGFLFAPEFSPDKHFGQDTPWQGLKPNSLSLLYGPTKVVP